MTNPITPPPELVRRWMERTEYDEHTWFYESYIAEQAAQWGADQELEACCLWVNSVDDDDCFGANLRAARRPKPPSLKEQALEVLERSCFVNPRDAITIRRALEQLDD